MTMLLDRLIGMLSIELDDVKNLIDETQFLVDLLKNEDITDDNGNMNDTVRLHKH